MGLSQAWCVVFHTLVTVRKLVCHRTISHLISPGSVEDQLVADSVEDNVSFSNTVTIVNAYIKIVDPKAEQVTINSINSCLDRLDPNVCSITHTSQGANYGPETP